MLSKYHDVQAAANRDTELFCALLGRDNERVLCGILGLSQGEIRDREAEGVIGTHPRGL